jgi:hypothetical protein
MSKLVLICLTFLAYAGIHETCVKGRFQMEMETRLRIELMRAVDRTHRPLIEIPAMRANPGMSL